ncbi:hypothetical protein ILYODFUR_022428 [Ilyodon furcidens]|uniref:Uncharacterized protein n=1 Tax=Ilyodon furcidens TaxID=33524 RepID=A0ABV0UX04_9TELE
MRIIQPIIHNLPKNTLTCYVNRKQGNRLALHQAPRTLKIEGGNEWDRAAHTDILSGGPEILATALPLCLSWVQGGRFVAPHTYSHRCLDSVVNRYTDVLY